MGQNLLVRSSTGRSTSVVVIGRAALVATLVATLLAAAPAAGAQAESEPAVEVPARPAGLEIATEPGSLDVDVDWDDVDGAAAYLVRWRMAGPGNPLNEGVEVESSEATIVVGGFGEWVVRVEACNAAGCGRPAAERFEVAAADEPVPEEPASEPAPTQEPDLAPAPESELELEVEPVAEAEPAAGGGGEGSRSRLIGLILWWARR